MAQLTVNEVLSKVSHQQSLRRAELSKIDLGGAALDRGNFAHAYLRQANLTGASCEGTDFSKATLVLAVLSDASMMGAQLEGANLAGANLAGVNLQQANLENANSTAVDFTDAQVAGAIFTDVQGLTETQIVCLKQNGALNLPG